MRSPSTDDNPNPSAILAQGDAAVSRQEYREGLALYTKSLLLSRELGEERSVADAHEKIGELYTTLGDYPNALEHYLNCLQIREESGEIDDVGRALHSIGVLYGLSGNYDEAYDYFDRSLDAFHVAGSSTMEVRALRNIGEIHFTRGELDKALDCGLRALAVYDALDDPSNVAATLIMLARIYEAEKRTDAAFQSLQSAQQALQGRSEYALQVEVLMSLGRIYRERGALDDARFVLEQGIGIAEEINDHRGLIRLRFELSLLLEEQGDFRNALEQHRRAVTLREEFAADDKQKAIADLQMRYDLDRALKDEEIRQRNNVVQAIIETQEGERLRIAGELHDGVGQILAAVRLNLMRVEDELDALSDDRRRSFVTAMHLLDNAGRDVRTIAHTLSSSTLQELGIVSALQEVVGTTASEDGVTFTLDVHGVGDRLPEEIELGLYRIAQELVTNVIKHASASRGLIQLIGSDESVVLMVEDNGVGFNPAERRRGGMGTRNMEARVGTMNGTIAFDSIPGHGTTVTVEVPRVQPTDGAA